MCAGRGRTKGDEAKIRAARGGRAGRLNCEMRTLCSDAKEILRTEINGFDQPSEQRPAANRYDRSSASAAAVASRRLRPNNKKKTKFAAKRAAAAAVKNGRVSARPALGRGWRAAFELILRLVVKFHDDR